MSIEQYPNDSSEDTVENNPQDSSKNNYSLNPFKADNIFTLSGRLNRMDYAILWFSLILITFIFMKNSSNNPILAAIAIMYSPEGLDEQMRTGQLINFIGLAALMLMAVRRFHDLGYAGWYSLALIIPIVGLILRMILLFAPGAPQANRFGEPPAHNHRNKVLILIAIIILLYMIFRSFVNEAAPQLEELFQELQSRQ